MRNNILRTRNNAVRGTIMVVLLFTLFTMMSFTAFASDQHIQSSRSHTVTSFVNAPSGNANLQWNPQTMALTATLQLSGLQPGSNHAAHIHAGNCSTEGKMLYPFNNVVADTAGNGISITTIDNITGGIPASGWDVTVHSGPTAEASPLLCGEIVNPTGAISVTVPLSAVDPMD
jgi:hypothetical protein